MQGIVILQSFEDSYFAVTGYQDIKYLLELVESSRGAAITPPFLLELVSDEYQGCVWSAQDTSDLRPDQSNGAVNLGRGGHLPGGRDLAIAHRDAAPDMITNYLLVVLDP